MGSKRSPAKPDTFANGPVLLDRWIRSQKQVLRCRNLQVLAQTDSLVILLSLDGDQWRFLADWKIWTVVLICLTLLSLLLVSFKEWYSENCSIFSSWDCRTSYNPFWEAGGFRGNHHFSHFILFTSSNLQDSFSDSNKGSLDSWNTLLRTVSQENLGFKWEIQVASWIHTLAKLVCLFSLCLLHIFLGR